VRDVRDVMLERCVAWWLEQSGSQRPTISTVVAPALRHLQQTTVFRPVQALSCCAGATVKPVTLCVSGCWWELGGVAVCLAWVGLVAAQKLAAARPVPDDE
jgi:hypothetical protein